GSDWDGTSGVHTHMTNTRITDAEVFERRYPVILREFSIRKGSRGRGEHDGGDGVIRDIEFRIPVQVSILSERRVFKPYGMAGGEPASRGVNYWMRKIDNNNHSNGGSNGANGVEEEEGRKYKKINMGGKNTASMKPGDRIIICTPGGGGYGLKGSGTSTPRDPYKKPRKIDPTLMWRGRGTLANRMATEESSY
ncbi:hypothetical protein TWF706_008067, partial [Orbilia oligospora]